MNYREIASRILDILDENNDDFIYYANMFDIPQDRYVAVEYLATLLQKAIEDDKDTQHGNL